MEPKDYPHVFYTSAKNGYYGIFAGTCCIVGAVYLSVRRDANLALVIGAALLGIIFLWLSVNSLLNTKPALKLGSRGIWTAKLGFHAWKNIQITLDSVAIGRLGLMEVLVIKQRQTKQMLETIAVRELSGPTQSLQFLLQQYKRS